MNGKHLGSSVALLVKRNFGILAASLLMFYLFLSLGPTGGSAWQHHKNFAEQEMREDPEAREQWFMSQRAYPFNAIPAEARLKAWRSRPDLAREAQPSQAPRWRSIGPSPTDAFFTVNWGQTSGRINAVAISPTDARLILIGASTGGIWRSTDAGETFVPVSDDQVDLAVGSIAFSKSLPTTVYAGMGDTKQGYLGSGVLKSTDAGRTWRRVNNSSLPVQGTASKLEVDPTNPNRVYLAQYTQLVNGSLFSSAFRLSTDGGVSWQSRLLGLPRDLVLHPIVPQTLYLGMSRVDESGSPPAGLYRSTDSGNTFSRIFTVPYDANRTTDIKVAATRAAPQTIYVYTGGSTGSVSDVRVVVSTDGGLTWINRGSNGLDTGQFGYNSYIFVDPVNALHVYVGSRDLYGSTNGGLSWTNLTGNFTAPNTYHPRDSNLHPDQHSLAFSPAASDVLYLGNDGGLYKSTNGGRSFASLNASLSLTQFVGLAVHPTDAAITYGGSQDNGTQRRVRGSSRWFEFFGGDGGMCVINPLDPATIFTTYIFGTIYRFRNGGDTFVAQVGKNETFGEPESGPRIAFYAPFRGNRRDTTLYFGTWRLFISTDLGGTWSAPAGTLDLTRGSTDVLSAIGVDGGNPNVIYTGSFQGRVMATTDTGRTWRQVIAGLPNRFISSIEVHPGSLATAYLTVSGFGSGHVFKTTNTGTSWVDISGNLPDIPANAVLVDPINSNTLYVGTDIGVFRSTNGGSRWEAFNAGLPPVVINAFTAQSSGLIQVASYGRGAFELIPGATAPAREASPERSSPGSLRRRFGSDRSRNHGHTYTQVAPAHQP